MPEFATTSGLLQSMACFEGSEADQNRRGRAILLFVRFLPEFWSHVRHTLSRPGLNVCTWKT